MRTIRPVPQIDAVVRKANSILSHSFHPYIQHAVFALWLLDQIPPVKSNRYIYSFFFNPSSHFCLKCVSGGKIFTWLVNLFSCLLVYHAIKLLTMLITVGNDIDVNNDDDDVIDNDDGCSRLFFFCGCVPLPTD